jgi:N-acetylmuramoyl-L-alanine amidase
MTGLEGFSAESALVSRVLPSPNFGSRKGQPVDLLLLHYTGMATRELALQRLCDPAAEVSCHYVVDEEGRIFQLVREADRAWHAGRGEWAGHRDLNSCSLGVEIVNGGHDFGLPAYPEAQISAVIALCCDLVKRYSIDARRVLAHSDIAPERKRDPGEKFPWDRLAAAGVGHWVTPEPLAGGRFFAQGDVGPPVEALQALFAAYGYGLAVDGVFGAQTHAVVMAFQRHFRPARVDGVADASTLATLHKLLKV